MSRSIYYMPAANGLEERRDLTYTEESARAKSLHLLFQDTGARASDARMRFLKAAYRDVVARYLRPGDPQTTVALLRDVVRSLDLLARGVDTRLDDYRDLGVYVLARELDVFYLLCTRGGSARVRTHGVFVPLSAEAVAGVRELSIDSARAQRDLFTPTLPDSLVLYGIDLHGRASHLELLLGGDPDDAGAAIDALEARRHERHSVIVSERARHAVMYAAFDASVRGRAAVAADATPVRASFPLRRATWVASAALLAAVVVGLAVTKPWTARGGQSDSTRGRASQERVAELAARRAPAEPAPEPAAPAATKPVPAPEATGFRVAWEKAYRAAVTSSPSPLGGAVVFGARDGKVYALDRASGEKVWTHAATGGVGASPLVRNDAVVVADYSGNVYRLARGDGHAVWKRALRERVVSTPASDGVRVAVGTVTGNVYALSLETGRVLWKFRTRGQIRGGIAHARDTYFVPSHDGRLYALAEDSGTRRWAQALGGPVSSSPASDGSVVVVGTARGEIMALDPTSGARRWAVTTRGAVNSGVEIDRGRVYAGSADGLVYCVDAADGRLVWRAETGGPILSKPFVGDGLVVVTSYDRRVYCFDADSGEVLDRYETSEAIFSSPAVIDGRVYFGNNAGRFYCLKAPRS